MISGKKFNIPYFLTVISTTTTLRAAYFIQNSCVKADINLKLMDEGEVLVSSSKASEILETTEKWKKYKRKVLKDHLPKPIS